MQQFQFPRASQIFFSSSKNAVIRSSLPKSCSQNSKPLLGRLWGHGKEFLHGIVQCWWPSCIALYESHATVARINLSCSVEMVFGSISFAACPFHSSQRSMCFCRTFKLWTMCRYAVPPSLCIRREPSTKKSRRMMGNDAQSIQCKNYTRLLHAAREERLTWSAYFQTLTA